MCVMQGPLSCKPQQLLQLTDVADLHVHDARPCHVSHSGGCSSAYPVRPVNKGSKPRLIRSRSPWPSFHSALSLHPGADEPVA